MKKAFELENVLYRLSEGNKTALEELFDYYHPRLYSFSKNFLKSHDGVNDILQEAFIKIWQNRKNISSVLTFNSYIFTVTRNLLLNELRSRLKDEKIKSTIEKQSVNIEYSLEQSEYNDLKEKFETVINELPNRQREVFILSRINGLSHNEIAGKLTITSKTVEYHISKASDFLKEKLKYFHGA